MHWNFNSDHLLFLSLKICPVVQKLGSSFAFQEAGVTAALVAAWILGSSSMHWKFNFDHFTFLSLKIHPAGQKLGVSFGSSFASS